MSRNEAFFLAANFVCLASAVICMSVPPDLPVIYPDDHSDLQDKSNQIPETLLIQMKDIQNLTQLLDFMGAPIKPGIGGPRPINGSPDDPTSQSESYNTTVDRRKLSGDVPGLDVSRAANCEPEMQTVELDKPIDPTHVYWPMCIRVPRCGGCCTSNLLDCVPVKTSKIEAKVLHAQYLAAELGGQFEVVGFKSLKVEKHDKCSCQCREHAEDCTPLQTYMERECRCMCTNTDAMEQCTGPKWIWDPRDCACRCREINECSTGFFFNGISCRCEIQRSSLVGRRGSRNITTFAKLTLNDSIESNLTESDAVMTENDTTARTTSTTSTPSKTSSTTSTTTSTTPTPSTTTSTTTTSKPAVRVRGRLGYPIGESLHHRAPHVGIRPVDYDDDAAPFTLSRSKGDAQSRKIDVTTTPSKKGSA